MDMKLKVSPLPSPSIAVIRQPRLPLTGSEETWPEEVWESLPVQVQRDALHHLAQLLVRWFATLERRP